MERTVIAYIGGGSKNWAPGYFKDFLLQDAMSGVIRLFDTDNEAANRNKRYFDKLVREHKDKVASDWECVVSTSIAHALDGADIVMISILPGTFEHMRTDVHMPERYGIVQPVGDTVGPGGYSRALRAIPLFTVFAREIRTHCPNAWVVNYTNPMSMLVTALWAEHPDMNVFGYCHEVFDSQRLYASVLEMYGILDDNGKEAFMAGDLKQVRKALGKVGMRFRDFRKLKAIDRHEVKVNVQGINHFTFVDRITYRGEDVYPVIRAFIRLFRKARADRLGWGWFNPAKGFFNRHHIKFAFDEEHGILGAAGDRHMAEFVPEMALPLGRKNVSKNGFDLTPIWVRTTYDAYRRWKIRHDLKPGVTIPLHRSDEDGVTQLIPLVGGKPLTTNLNVINTGQMPDLPLGTAVETNVTLSSSGIVAEPAGHVTDPAVRDLMIRHATNQKMFVQAYRNKDFEGLLEVFLSDPSVARLSEEDGTSLFCEMIDVNRDALEDWVVRGKESYRS